LIGLTVLVAAAAHGGSGPAEFTVDPDWPALPEGFATGETAGVDVDSHGHVFVFHRGQRHSVMALDPDDGRKVASFGDDFFVNAHGLEVDAQDNVWVTDTRRHQVLKFSHDGELLLSVGEEGVAGLDATHFNQPTDVVVTPSGEFYVSDGYGNSRVAKFSADGTFLFDWGTKGDAPGQFNLPHGITLDDEGRVYVADRSNLRVQIFTPDGDFLAAWGADVFGDEARPWGLEFHAGRIYVIDGGNMNPNTPDYARLTIVEKDGRVVTSWSSYGSAPGQLSWGHDVTVGLDGSVYTAEVRNNNRAQKFIRTRR
jgi:peptidylamidoglycolate lyase